MIWLYIPTDYRDVLVALIYLLLGWHVDFVVSDFVCPVDGFLNHLWVVVFFLMWGNGLLRFSLALVVRHFDL